MQIDEAVEDDGMRDLQEVQQDGKAALHGADRVALRQKLGHNDSRLVGAVVEILEDFAEEAAVSVTCADVGLEAGPQHGLYKAAHFLVCGGQALAHRGSSVSNLRWILKTQIKTFYQIDLQY